MRCRARRSWAPVPLFLSARRARTGSASVWRGVHWLASLAAFRIAVEGAWSWDVAEFPAPARTWRFRRYGVDLGVRFGCALGFVRPWADVGLVLGTASRFVERSVLVAGEVPVFDPGYPAVVELLGSTSQLLLSVGAVLLLVSVADSGFVGWCGGVPCTRFAS